MVLVVAFVAILSSMPPLTLVPRTTGWSGYQISVDTVQWRHNATTYVSNLVHGKLGVDRKGKPIGPKLAYRFESSLLLLGLALTFAIGLGVLKGIRDFRSLQQRRGGWGPALTNIVQGIPDFWLVIMLQLLAIWLYKLLGWRILRVVYSDNEQLRSLIVPVIALSLIPGATIARITSAALTTVWEHDYIRTATAKGLHENKVLYKHAFRNAAVQILDALPNISAVILSNLLVVEYMTNYPGLTTLLYDAMPRAVLVPGQPPGADTPVLAAAGICLGVTISLLHFAISLVRRLVDPRLKEQAVA